MKVLVATSRTQGQRSNDLCLAHEGELVTWGSECAPEAHDVDALCCCQRAMIGLTTLDATTTVQVVERVITPEGLYRLMAEFHAREGTLSMMCPKEVDALIRQDIEGLRHAVEPFEIGAVLERRGDSFIQRTPEPMVA